LVAIKIQNVTTNIIGTNACNIIIYIYSEFEYEYADIPSAVFTHNSEKKIVWTKMFNIHKITFDFDEKTRFWSRITSKAATL